METISLYYWNEDILAKNEKNVYREYHVSLYHVTLVVESSHLRDLDVADSVYLGWNGKARK